MSNQNEATGNLSNANAQPYTLLGLDLLDIAAGIQSRTETNQETVEEYAGAMLRGIRFPPIIVFFDGFIYWLVDGFHRVLAARKAGLKELYADVRTGTERDARLFAAGVNRGLLRTNADKRLVVTMLLTDPEWRQWSDQRIADHCGVSDRFVSSVRLEVPSANGSEMERLVVRNGVEYTMDTKNIGRSDNAEAPPDERGTLDALQQHMLYQYGPLPEAEARAKGSSHEVSAPGNPETETPGPVAPAPPAHTFTSPERWAQQTWVPVNGDGATMDITHSILVTIPDTMPLNRGLQVFVERARKLGCSVFLTPDLQNLVDGDGVK